MFADKITVFAFKEYFYCPRIPFFMINAGFNPTSQKWIERGNRYQLRQTFLQKRRKLKRFNLSDAQIIYDVELECDKYEFYGKVDMLLLTENFVYPVDFKLNSDSKFKNNVMQICCYGLLAEEIYQKKFEIGFLVSGEKAKVYPIEYDENKKRLCLEQFEKFKKIICGDLLPDSSASYRQCSICRYKNFCNDRDI